MPCNSDHCEPTQYEVELSRIYALLDELQTGELTKRYGEGYDRRAYGCATKTHLDQKTEELCSKLQKTDVTKYSLEMQIWWRDHQQADKERVKRELNSAKNEQERKEALAKLTDHERQLLGL